MRGWFGKMATWCAAAWKTRRLSACCWPGLPQLWFDGSWRGLVVAVGFAALFDVLVAVSFVWQELASPATRAAAWIVLAIGWLAAAIMSWRSVVQRNWQNGGEKSVAGAEDLYPAAVNEYLKRNFVAAERMAQKLLAGNERDIPASLLLASVWRRTGRSDQAREELERLGRLEASRPWSLEIERELARLKTSKKAADGQPQEANLDKPAEIQQAA